MALILCHTSGHDLCLHERDTYILSLLLYFYLKSTFTVSKEECVLSLLLKTRCWPFNKNVCAIKVEKKL